MVILFCQRHVRRELCLAGQKRVSVSLVVVLCDLKSESVVFFGLCTSIVFFNILFLFMLFVYSFLEVYFIINSLSLFMFLIFFGPFLFLLSFSLLDKRFSLEDEKSVVITYEDKLDLVLAEAFARFSKLNLAE